ncbi:hypothetical protein [Variovorax ginsengisoli]|uniref:Type IV pilus biogenesis protein PilP n=1 Tax=Variovorax ginsengisoli TaxID=363844 RepID=A0ABT8S9T2_9BURK|nr:hypothetical protein [Variovorax ginsengisoli]MDN8616504.1 hypothetical protein [Variovorax ginsengisoli]MDO1535674.1 hypothetical protein [Variovorax ginsengisoli]
MKNLRLRQATALAVTVLAGLALTSGALAADVSAALDSAPQSEAMRNSVVTVDTLVKNENQQALARSMEQSVASGLIQPAKPAAPSGPPAGQIFILSIFGIGNDLRAHMSFNGEGYERVRVGARMGSCVISEITGNKVVLKPSRKGVPPATCPTGKWTGVNYFQPAPGLASPAESGRPGGAALASPAIPTPFSSTSTPSRPLQPVSSGPAPLKVSQPTIQLIPGGPVAPGQTAVPLIPPQLEAVQDERLQQPAAAN